MPAFWLPLAGAGCQKNLPVFQIGGDLVSFEVDEAGVRLSSVVPGAQAKFALPIACPDWSVIDFPLLTQSTWTEAPWLAASVSGEVRSSFASQADRLTLLVSSGSAAVALSAFFPSAGDAIALGSGSAREAVGFADQAATASASWGETFFVTPEAEGWLGLVSSLMLLPTLPSHVRPVTGCTGEAALVFAPDQGSGCSLAGGSETAIGKGSWRNRLLYAAQPSGKYWPVTLPPAEKPTLPGEVAVSEIMWMGSLRDEVSLSLDEWVELANRTPKRFNLRGMKIEGGTVSGGALLVNVDLWLEPYGLVVVGRRGGADTGLVRDPDWVTTSLSLNNEGASLTLRAQNGTQLDKTPVGSWQAGRNDPDIRASAQRRSLSAAGNDWGNWGDCAAMAPACLARGNFWRAGNRQNLGTPWQPNVL